MIPLESDPQTIDTPFWVDWFVDGPTGRSVRHPDSLCFFSRSKEISFQKNTHQRTQRTANVEKLLELGGSGLELSQENTSGNPRESS